MVIATGIPGIPAAASVRVRSRYYTVIKFCVFVRRKETIHNDGQILYYSDMIGLYRRTLSIVLPAFVISEQICYLPISLSYRELIRGSAIVILGVNVRVAFE